MRGTTLLVAATVAGVLLVCPYRAHAEDETDGAAAPIPAAEYLGTQRHALVIGIDDHADGRVPDLESRESSARGVRSVLVDPSVGGLPEANVELLLGAEATAAKIRAALARLQDLPREATVFVYFAGHGATQGEAAYWVAQDSKASDLSATAVADAEVRGLLGGLPAERILLMMDCRHAPGLSGEGTARTRHADALARYHGARYATLGAAGAEEHTVEADDAPRAVFTHYLVEGLSGLAEADGDGIVDLGELAAYVAQGVRAESRERRGLERPVVDLEGVSEPSRFFLTIEQEGFMLRLEEDEPAQAARREQLAALTAVGGEGRITVEQDRLGRHLLGGLEEGFSPHELEQRTLFVDLAAGRLDPRHLAAALAAVRRPDRRTLVVPDEFKRIQAAIDAARAGDTVLVKEGRYREHVVFKSGLCLRGEGRERTVIEMVAGEPEILLAEDCGWGVIESLQLDGSGGTQIKDWSPDGFHLKGASVRVLDCLAYRCVGGGMYAEGEGSCPYVRECTFEQNGQDGVCLSGTAGGAIVECISRSNGAVGIQVRQSRGAVVVRGCECEANPHAGIAVCGGSTATVEDNACQNNVGHGIIVWEKDTSVTLVNNDCSRNQINGIYVVQHASVVATGNECSRNRECGFVSFGVGTRATIAGGRFLENGSGNSVDFGGIVFRDGATGEATSNTCDGNPCGILVKGSGASARLRDNTCRKNQTSGIEFSAAAPGHAAGNRCEENGHGITVARCEAALEGNTLERNTAHGIIVSTRAACKASGNRCEGNARDGIHVTDMATRAELLENTCASNEGNGIQFARGAGGTADGNECSGNTAFGIVAADSGTRPTFRHNRCTNNGRAGIGKTHGALPVVEGTNVQSGNGD